MSNPIPIPIDTMGEAAPPASSGDVIKVAPCPGGPHLPHGGPTDTIKCLREALATARAEIVGLQRTLRLERMQKGLAP